MSRWGFHSAKVRTRLFDGYWWKVFFSCYVLVNNIWIVLDQQFCQFSRWTADKFIFWYILRSFVLLFMRQHCHLLAVMLNGVEDGGSYRQEASMMCDVGCAMWCWVDVDYMYIYMYIIYKPDDNILIKLDLWCQELPDYILDPVCKVCLCFIKLVTTCNSM